MDTIKTEFGEVEIDEEGNTEFLDNEDVKEREALREKEEKAKNEVWKVKGEGKPVIEVWESFNGDLYFVVEKNKNGEIFCYARLYSMPEFAEWGWNDIDYLQQAYGKYKIWKVPRRNWEFIDTYEKGLLQRVK